LERASALNSPVAGRVQQLEVNTFGQVVQTG
jgi:hemolysin D